MISRYSATGLALLGIALYGGPLLAGLARHGWAVLPVFAGLFLLYMSARRGPDLATGAGWAGLAIMALVQAVLVTLVWGAGLGLAALFGAIALPLWAPLLLTAIAAGFGAWAHRDAAEMDVMLDSVLEALEARAEAGPSDAAGEKEADWPETPAEVHAALEEALEALYNLDKLEPAVIDPVVARLDAAVGVAAFDPFYDVAGLEGDDNDPLIDFALLRFVARPHILTALIGRGEGGLAPTLLLDAPSEEVRAEARARVGDLLDAAAPDDQLPDIDWLAQMAAQFEGEGYETLARRCYGP